MTPPAGSRSSCLVVALLAGLVLPAAGSDGSADPAKAALARPGTDDASLEGQHQSSAADLCFPLDPSYTLSLPPGDDDSSNVIVLPFNFCLYGDSYTNLFVNNNGNVSFNQPYGTFSAVGFPSNQFVMVAPFWADVDTGNGLGTVHHKIFGSSTIAITWDQVGYFSVHGDKRNTFQVVLSDGTDPALGIGNNVCFCYDDMQWTTGDASGGMSGFGGTPALAGANRGNGVDFFQLGRFDHAGADYDGPFGGNDGVSFLDGQVFCFNACPPNVPPIAADVPPGNEVTVSCLGGVVNEDIRFLSPEASQTTSVTVADPNGAQARGLVVTTNPGNPAHVHLNWVTDPGDAGDYVLTLTAQDSFTPPGVTVITVTLHVECPNSPPQCNLGGPYTSTCRTLLVNLATASDPDGDPIDYTLDGGASVTFAPASGTLMGAGIVPVPPSTATLDAAIEPCAYTQTITLHVEDPDAASSTCTTTVTFDDTVAPVPTAVLVPAPPRPPASAASVCSGPATDRFEVVCLATDNCDAAPASDATIVVTNHDATGPGLPCTVREDRIPVACGEIVEIDLLAPPCPSRPRPPQPPSGVNSAGLRTFTGEQVVLEVTATDACGNTSLPATFDPATAPDPLCETRLPDGTCCPALTPPEPGRCNGPLCTP